MRYETWESDRYRPRRRAISGAAKLARGCCLLYGSLLGFVLLFIGNPTKFVDAPAFQSLYSDIEPGLHVGLFACLAFLVSAARWPVNAIVQATVLILFAAGSEAIQIWLPNRTPRWGCFIQDVAGLFLGFVTWIAASDLLASFRRWRR
tara:strand:- start:3802 stop:4245 length:444 start_codon:yes stop_codon:yes gene_type:complete